jgi:hypothetical protein
MFIGGAGRDAERVVRHIVSERSAATVAPSAVAAAATS